VLTAFVAWSALAADAPVPKCPYVPFDRQALLQRLSANAEAVAPSAATSGRRRAVRTDGPLPVSNFIDTFINSKLQKTGVMPTVIAGDEEFLRRVTLDLTGEIPDRATVEAFVADPSSKKREQKIDQLITSDAFTDRWTMWFGDLVQNVLASTIPLYYPGRNAYYSSIRDSIRNHKPYDQMVRELIANTGDSVSGAPANYAVRQFNGGPPEDLFDNLATFSFDKFLGVPLLCVSCHSGAGHLESVNTYLRGRSRQEFWQTAAFFSRTRLRFTVYPDPLSPKEQLNTCFLTESDTGRYDLNTTDGAKSPRVPAAGQPDYAMPKFVLSGEEPQAGESYRVAFARILTSNRQFARATVNDLWKEMFGLGIVEPAHGFDLAKLDSQPTHPELLETLSSQFISSGYDLRSVLRAIAMSSTYQLSSRYTPGAWNETWVPLYARHYPRRMMAEMLFDAVVKSTGVSVSIDVRGMQPVARSMQLPDTSEPNGKTPIGRFLNSFGRGNRDDAPRTSESSIMQTLGIMNDPLVTTRVRRDSANSTVGRIVAATSDPGAIVDELYLTTLNRRPTAAERQTAIDELSAGPIGERAEDLQYALLNTLEFLFN